AAIVAKGPLALGAAAFVGMLNGMGRDRGAALVIEQALLPATAEEGRRTRAFAVYNVLQDAGHALGGLMAGLPALLRHSGMAPLAAQQATMGLYAVLALVPLPLYLLLSSGVEGVAEKRTIAPESRRILVKISAL